MGVLQQSSARSAGATAATSFQPLVQHTEPRAASGTGCRTRASTLAVSGRSRIGGRGRREYSAAARTKSPAGQTKRPRLLIRRTGWRQFSSRMKARQKNTAVVASVLGTVAVRTVNRMISVEFCDPGTVGLQFSLRRAHIIATLCAFHPITTVDSQPAGVVSEDSCA
jgi:hypothetical protein